MRLIHLTYVHGTKQTENVIRTNGKAEWQNGELEKNQTVMLEKYSRTQRSFRNQKVLKIPNQILL